jgi:hypothetical protein
MGLADYATNREEEYEHELQGVEKYGSLFRDSKYNITLYQCGMTYCIV